MGFKLSMDGFFLFSSQISHFPGTLFVYLNKNDDSCDYHLYKYSKLLSMEAYLNDSDGKLEQWR